MAIDSLDIRMARLEGAYAQINERLGSLENRLVAEIGGLRSEVRADIDGLRSEVGADIGGLRSEIGALRGEVRSDLADLRRQVTTQFYWVLTFVLGSILLPLLRDVAR